LKTYGDGSSDFGFTGEQDEIAGLIFLRARYYDPGIGRFISKDPFPGVLTLPSSLHPYQYALNNPIRFTDPTGQVVWIPGILLIGAGIGGIANLINYLSTPGCLLTWQGVINSFLVGALAGAIGTGVTMLVASLIPAILPGLSPILAASIAGGAGGVASTIIESLVTRKPIVIKNLAIDFFVAAASAGVASLFFPSRFFPSARYGPSPKLSWTSGWPLRNAYVGVKSMYVVYEEIIEDVIGSVVVSVKCCKNE
jgi:RHS repeat-associated protein